MSRENHHDSVLTAREVAHLLNIHIDTVRRWCELRILKAYRVGLRGDWRFKWEDVLTFLPPADRGGCRKQKRLIVQPETGRSADSDQQQNSSEESCFPSC